MKKILVGFLLWSLLTIVGFAHAGTVTYVYTDPQGTPLAEADASGNITATFEYTPYGTYAPQGTSAPGLAPNSLGYTGHVNDPETNLVYMQARYYDPATGRLLSVDPIDPEGGDIFKFNRYAYVDNNPIVRIDPDGRDPDFAFGVGVGLSPWISDKDKAFLQRVFAEAHLNSTVAGVGVGQSIKEVAETKNISKEALATIAVKAAVVLLNRGRSSGPMGATTRVGRWMSPKELQNMKKTGVAQESFTGTTHVASPADASTFIKQAETGSVYVEFDVPSSSVKATSENGVAKLIGPNTLEGRAAARAGRPIPEMPQATNIEHVATKIGN